MTKQEFLDITGLTRVIDNVVSLFTTHKANHAPSDAEKNIIVGVQKNGTDLTVNSSTRKINIPIPTKISELENDCGFVESGLVEIISDTEPTGQDLNSYWIKEY